MSTLAGFARLGRVVWRTYGARGLARRSVHEARRAAGGFRSRPANDGTSLTNPAPPSGYRPACTFANLPHEVRTRIVARGDRVRGGCYQAFGHAWRAFPDGADAWAESPDGAYRFPSGAWWTVPHLPPGADVKDVWEPGRFGWAYDLVRAHHLTGDPTYAQAFYARLAEWVDACPPFAGVHWSCGQEVAIRALALLHAEAALPPADAAAAERVARVFAWSGERIADAVGYGLSQRNNHGISEAAGLIHLGLRLAGGHQAAARWLARGRRLLDEQIIDQFERDGWYAQHSFVYMRVALSQALAAQRALQAAGYSLAPAALARLGAAARLLALLVDAETGEVPNFGANDGSQVLPLSSAPYGDFRPVLTLAAGVLGQPLPADVRPDPEVLAWLNAALGSPSAARADGVWTGAESGWVVVRHEGARAFLRAGPFRHRPSHMDLLHLSVAWAGREVVADAGTFAYNAPPPWANGLTSARLHNAPVLDGVEPAARGPRFLWKNWPTARLVEAVQEGGTARVVAEVPGRVRRVVVLGRGEVAVEDLVLDSAVHSVAATWLLHPTAQAAQVEGPEADVVRADPECTDAWFSPTYGVRVPTRAVRVSDDRSVGGPLRLVTRIRPPAATAAADA